MKNKSIVQIKGLYTEVFLIFYQHLMVVYLIIVDNNGEGRFKQKESKCRYYGVKDVVHMQICRLLKFYYFK